MGELPPKLFFRIGEVAGLVGVEPHVLRYWEREFRSIRPTKSAKGQRVYSRKDVENLLRVRDLLYRDGFTIAGAKKKLQRGDEGGATATSAEPAAERYAEADGDALIELESGEAANGEPGLDGDARLSAAEELTDPSPVASGAGLDGAPPHVREKLVALRHEVEAFLAELSSNPRR